MKQKLFYKIVFGKKNFFGAQFHYHQYPFIDTLNSRRQNDYVKSRRKKMLHTAQKHIII